MQPLIQIEAMTKVFYTEEIETHALSGVHLSIDRGEYVAMSGPSGCGKSTLLSIIGLLDTPTAGKYELNGRPVENLKFAERSRIRNQEIGFIFQSFNLIGDLTVAENVELPLTYRSGMASSDRKQRVQESLERVGMAHRMRHYPSQLSGGQQQRVAVARALAGSPSILLADEPTGNLDSRNGEAVMELLKNLHREGATICMVTHDPRFARHADRERPSLRRQVVAEARAIEHGPGNAKVTGHSRLPRRVRISPCVGSRGAVHETAPGRAEEEPDMISLENVERATRPAPAKPRYSGVSTSTSRPASSSPSWDRPGQGSRRC